MEFAGVGSKMREVIKSGQFNSNFPIENGLCHLDKRRDQFIHGVPNVHARWVTIMCNKMQPITLFAILSSLLMCGNLAQQAPRHDNGFFICSVFFIFHQSCALN